MNDETPRGIGDNRAPVVTDEEIIAFVKRRDELIEASKSLPADFEDEETARKATELAKTLAAYCADLDGKRKTAKQPSLSEGRTIDAAFSALAGPIAKIVEQVKAPLLRYMDWQGVEQIRSEHGALAFIRTSTVIDSWNRKRLDIETLRNFLDRDAIERAIRAYIETTGKRKLRGAKIVEKSSVTIR